MENKQTSIHITRSNNQKTLGLSAREFDVLACLLDNMSTKKIASSLSIASPTVEVHIRSIITKLGCNTRREIHIALEKLDDTFLIRKHCTDLLTQISFEQELKKLCYISSALIKIVVRFLLLLNHIELGLVYLKNYY